MVGNFQLAWLFYFFIFVFLLIFALLSFYIAYEDSRLREMEREFEREEALRKIKEAEDKRLPDNK